MGPSQALLSMDSTNYNQLNLNGGLSVSSPIVYSGNSLPCFKMMSSADQSLTGTQQAINFGTILWNLGGGILTTTRYIAPLSGYYQVSTAVNLGSQSTIFYLEFRTNGYMRHAGSQSAATTSNMSTILYLNAGDDIEVRVDLGSTANTCKFISGSEIKTWFSGYLIRGL